MINYLLTNYPVLYFVLALCMITTGLILVHDAATQLMSEHFSKLEQVIEEHLTITLLIALNNIDEGIYFRYVFSQKPIILGYTYFELFAVDQSYTFVDKPPIQKRDEKKTLSKENIDIKPLEPESNNETIYPDIGDIIRMKMGLLSVT